VLVLQPRILGADRLVPLSYALSAPAAAAWGARATLIGAGVVGAALTAGFLFVPGVRDPDSWNAESDDASSDAPDGDGSQATVLEDAA